MMHSSAQQKHIKAGTLNVQSNLTHLESPVRQTATSVLAELVVYHGSLRKLAAVYGAPTFEEEVWGYIAERTFDENHFVVSTAFSAVRALCNPVRVVCRVMCVVSCGSSDGVRIQSSWACSSGKRPASRASSTTSRTIWSSWSD
jgi:hypothetical protein